MSNPLNEYTIGDIHDKQKDITKLFPTFYDRVSKVEEKGGTRLLKKYPRLLHFKTHSGTKDRVWYDNYIKFVNLEKFLADAVQDKSTWNSRGNKVVLRKVAERLIEEGNVQFLCSCPAQNFWGGNYILSRPSRDAKYGKAENRPPKVNNPNELGALCKHGDHLLNSMSKYKITIARWLGKVYKDVMQDMVDKIRAGEKKHKVMEHQEQEVSALDPEEAEKIEQEEEPIETGDAPEEEVESPQETEEDPEEEEQKEAVLYPTLSSILNEEGDAPAATDGATTEDDISYIPGGFKKVISKIKKKKNKGKIKVLEASDGIRIYEDGSLFVFVPDAYINDFAENLLEELAAINNSLIGLNEVNEAEMDKQRKLTRKSVLSSFKKRPFTDVVNRYLLWRRIFPKSKTITPDSVAVPVPHFEKRARQLADAAVKDNWDDRGTLEQIMATSLSAGSLSQFEPFGSYDYIYGVVIRSSYNKVPLEYSLLVSPDLKAREQIKVGDKSVLADISDPGINISGNIITPKFKSGLFNREFIVQLRDTIDDITE